MRLAIYELNFEHPFSDALVVMQVKEMQPPGELEERRAFIVPSHPTVVPTGTFGVIIEKEEDRRHYQYVIIPNAWITIEDEGGFWVAPLGFSSQGILDAGLTYALYVVVQTDTVLPLTSAQSLYPMVVWVDGDKP